MNQPRERFARFRLARGIGAFARHVVVVERHQRKTLLAPVIYEQVMGDRVQPRGKARFWCIALARLDHAHPDLLEQLFGDATVPDRAQDEAEKAAPMAGIEGLERPGVSA